MRERPAVPLPAEIHALAGWDLRGSVDGREAGGTPHRGIVDHFSADGPNTALQRMRGRAWLEDPAYDADPLLDLDQTPAFDPVDPDPIPDYDVDQTHGA